LSYQEKGALVDELVELSGFHRKSVLRLLRQQPADHGGPPARADAGLDSAEVGRCRRYCRQRPLEWCKSRGLCPDLNLVVRQLQ
jgi:hypothetical protein